MRRLGEAYPRALAIDEIAAKAPARAALLRLYAGNMARLATEPFPVGRDAGEKPSPIRWRAPRRGSGSAGDSYRHSQVSLEGDDTRHFLALLDGTRTIDALVDAMSGSASGTGDTRAKVEAALATFALWGLTRSPAA